MRVFVTGASGGIGSAVVSELTAAGHRVVGLARSEASAATISRLGGEPLGGDIAELDVLKRAAGDTDGVIYLAFNHDFTDVGDAIGAEARAVAALGEALVDTGKPLVLASGTPPVAGRLSTENDPFTVDGPMAGRGRTGRAVIDLAERGVRSSVVRLPRSVHDAGGRYGFASILIQAARRSGVSAYVGDGAHRWPAVHRDDAAQLFRLALEQAPPGSVLHAVGDEGDQMRAIAEVIGRRLGVRVESAPAERFGALGTIFAVDQPSSSALTRERFGWNPTHPSLLEDLETGDYPG
jgi:nucleoside-diphosphate-sugar epimerase